MGGGEAAGSFTPIIPGLTLSDVHPYTETRTLQASYTYFFLQKSDRASHDCLLATKLKSDIHTG